MSFGLLAQSTVSDRIASPSVDWWGLMPLLILAAPAMILLHVSSLVKRFFTGFYAAYTTPPLMIYGTAWILILAFATRFLPIAYANADAAIRSINPELEDAVRILGGRRLLAIRRVVVPLLKRGLAGAFILVFIPATRELSAAIFLYSINTQVLSVLLFDKSDEGNFEMLAAIGLILVAITTSLILLGFRLLGRDFMLRRTAA